MVECWAENPTERPTFAQIVDKLTVQKQLYVDLDCVFPPSEDEIEGLRDYDFNMADANGLHDRDTRCDLYSTNTMFHDGVGNWCSLAGP
uniref:Uncharacterized protein n=1 Tax=Heliothis virescens TaxID=7102 RepID=A0A2A4ISE8_HELVI